MTHIDPQLLATSLGRLDHGPQDIGQALEQTVKACVALFGVTGSGFMIADQESTLRDAAASDRPGRILEKVQVDAGQGPCVDAFVNGIVTHADDLTTESRWPDVTPTLVSHGVLSVLGVPVRLGGVPIGSLDVYRDEIHHWDDSEHAALVRYSDVIGTTLTAAMAAHRAGKLAEQLQYALDYRVVIERAIGYLMASQRLGPSEAFGLLRRTARNQRRKAADIAQHLLEHGELPAGPK
jgi:GAF domain-containing protein